MASWTVATAVSDESAAENAGLRARAGHEEEDSDDEEEVIVLQPMSSLAGSSMPAWSSSSLTQARASGAASAGPGDDVGALADSLGKASLTENSSDKNKNGGSGKGSAIGPTRIMIVLDLNGLVVRRRRKKDVPSHALKDLDKPGGPTSAGKMYYAWRRPFADDFVHFLTKNFDLVVWSSARLENIKPMLDIVFNDEARSSILGIMDQSDCRVAGKRPDDRHRPLFIKELSRAWAKFPQHGPQSTLLVDDSRYKAVRNPPNTAIHPKDWEIEHVDDDSLGPGGNMRSYLEKLAEAASRPDFQGVPAHVATNTFHSGRSIEELSEERKLEKWTREALQAQSKYSS
ncbi:Hypothetical Protein FCC1311_028952 [Hondaea fermentalgiana]|uniref:Mitochondrial import inner membrane translocase subunit TIM50 n=1 Tax=Hondaea fermentalgiana TaxID=2315210 RepID=A0A2R5GFP0_9STRA|nr:Hypothetical Protein FCC1311_028952 [Hondaea fermentalgiana]|eukprot:GBG26674.1 Hypothetical Protein FCC1311_028952 [Hondaea fermentalgiana]